mgnify:CR=1 FL=1|jgi:hypothetical protein
MKQIAKKPKKHSRRIIDIALRKRVKNGRSKNKETKA